MFCFRRLVLTVAASTALGLAPSYATDELKALAALERWLTAVREHEVGTWDAAAERIAAWSDLELDAIVPTVETLFELLREPASRSAGTRHGFSATFVEQIRLIARTERAGGRREWIHTRGALLHADIMMFGPPLSGTRTTVPQAQRGTLLGTLTTVHARDGEHEGYSAVGVHWPFARFLLDGVRSGPAGDGFVRAWYRATAAFLLQRQRFAETEPHLTHARRRLPADPGVHLDSARLYETYAASGMQTMAAASRARGARVDVPPADESLRLAERHLLEALALDTQRLETRVRLSRVRLLLGRAAEAVPDLEAASAGTAEVSIRYYASLFLGQAYETLGRIDAARSAYQHAADLYPSSQPAHLALSMLALGTGDRETAKRSLRTFLTAPAADGENDPWWAYHKGNGRQLATAMVDLWASAGRVK